MIKYKRTPKGVKSMANGRISSERILTRLDEFLHKNDYASAERHLLYWLAEAENDNDTRTELLVCNELMGLYRKLSRESEALSCVKRALEKIEKEKKVSGEKLTSLKLCE